MDQDSCLVGLCHMLVLSSGFRSGQGKWRHCWYSAAPPHQNLSSHGQCDCHLSIELVHSYSQRWLDALVSVATLLFAWLNSHVIQVFYPPCYCQAEVLKGSRGIVSYCLCLGRGRRAMNDAEIFIWVPPQGTLTVQDYNSLILQVLIHKFKDGEHYHWLFMGSVMQSTT